MKKYDKKKKSLIYKYKFDVLVESYFFGFINCELFKLYINIYNFIIRIFKKKKNRQKKKKNLSRRIFKSKPHYNFFFFFNNNKSFMNLCSYPYEQLIDNSCRLEGKYTRILLMFDSYDNL